MEILSVLQGLQQYDKATTDKVSQTARKDRSGQQSSAQSGDSVRVSGQGRLVNSARQTAMESDDMRAEKVQRLKTLVESGEYVIDTQKTAAKIVEEELDMFR